VSGTSGTRKVTGVTAGTVTAASTDAVNGAQLYNTAASTAAAMGGGAGVDANGGITAPTYTVAAPIFVDLSGGKVIKSTGIDTYTSVAKIVGTTGDDVFTFNTQADVTKTSQDGGGGHDVLQKSGSSAGTYDLTTMMAKVTNIEKIDFSTSTTSPTCCRAVMKH
jgi:hypothetical protein